MKRLLLGLVVLCGVAFGQDKDLALDLFKGAKTKIDCNKDYSSCVVGEGNINYHFLKDKARVVVTLPTYSNDVAIAIGAMCYQLVDTKFGIEESDKESIFSQIKLAGDSEYNLQRYYKNYELIYGVAESPAQNNSKLYIVLCETKKVVDYK